MALALPAWLTLGSWAALLYPLYYLALFVPRQLEDDEACALKYGDAWKKYCRVVPYRIVPYVY